jgi:hypothetical protein
MPALLVIKTTWVSINPSSNPKMGVCWTKKRAKSLFFTSFFHYNPSFTTKRAGFYRPFFLVVCFSMQGFSGLVGWLRRAEATWLGKIS